MNFDTAFKLLVEHEKGYTDDPDDPCNWTGGKVGVSTPDLQIKKKTS